MSTCRHLHKETVNVGRNLVLLVHTRLYFTMKYLTIMRATISGLMVGNVKAFVLAGAGTIMARPSSKSIFSHVDTTPRWSLGGSATHHFGCFCSSCSRGYSLRSLQMGDVCGKNCLCSSCAKQRSSAVLMRAHAPRCGCEVCSANVLPRAFHDGPCGYLFHAPSHRAVFPHSACIGSSTSMTLGEGTSIDQQVELDVTARAFMQKLKEDPASVSFEDTMSTINEAFDYTPKRFINGAANSDAGVNEGSCKVFSFGKIAGLSETETLGCFGEHYRSVLEDPSGDSHGNIRAFMKTGWGGISFPDGGAIHSRRG